MKRLLFFAAMAGVLLGSATPPSEAGVAAPVSEPPAPPPLAPATPVAIASAPPEAVSPEAPAPPPPPPPPPAPEPIPSDGVHIVVSIPQQKAYVFENGMLLDTTSVSTGRRGYETPVGTFPILQKKVHHRSSTYDNAPMPYMQRLTWSGVALHAGRVPGYPASHGCIRLPRSFAKKLYGITSFGTRVTITRERPQPDRRAAGKQDRI